MLPLTSTHTADMTEEEQKRVKQEAVKHAIEARSNAYAPYSEYNVGACIATITGENKPNTSPSEIKYYTGANIENANFTNTTHAEQNAINKAVLNGHTDFLTLAVATKNGDENGPCGLCQQHLIEHAPETIPILIQTTNNQYNEKQLADCTPFNPDTL